MDSFKSRTALSPSDENFDLSTRSNMMTMALTALRISFPKVPHSSKISEGKSETLPEISLEEVSNHDHMADCWVVIYDRVYDVTKFLETHPGGGDVMLDYAGMDCTIAFRGTGHSKVAIDMLDKYIVGHLPSHQQIFRKSSGGIRFSDMPE